MRHGMVKVRAATVEISVANPEKNADRVIKEVLSAEKEGVSVLAFNELTLTGYTASDLFYQRKLLSSALDALFFVAKQTAETKVLFFVGLPLAADGGIFNAAAAVFGGKVLGFALKTHLPNYGEFYEKRQFVSADVAPREATIGGVSYPMGNDLLFRAENLPECAVFAEVCEDLWVADPPSVTAAAAGATIVVNLSASDETVGKAEYRRALVSMQSAKLVAGYVYADAGRGESSTDMVFAGHNLVAENGKILAETELFSGDKATSEIDVFALAYDRARLRSLEKRGTYREIRFTLRDGDVKLTRFYGKTPFVPAGEELQRRAKLILRMQAEGLRQRMAHTGIKKPVLGLSGGLDSTLALLVSLTAVDLLGLPRKNIVAVTMPCFGTTDRTYHNAVALAKTAGAELLEIPLKTAVMQHFKDIGHDPAVTDTVYENSQARERTQVLMDLAGKVGGLVVGTGDLSELALGWATYNGDHMSNYAVNASVPKTLVRYLVKAYADSLPADRSGDALRKILYDVIETPVSPELLPPKGGEIAQKTEDLVGPYELHDFFLYYFLRYGFPPEKIFYLACTVFCDTYDKKTIKKWLVTFYRRFFSQQFKRSCLPDGVKIGSVTLSPRGDFRMPSDADAGVFLQEAQALPEE